MKVTVMAYGDLRRMFGAQVTVELQDGAKLKDLILKMKGRVTHSGKAFLGSYKLEDSSLVVLVNGRNMHALKGLDTILKDSDSVTLMPVLIGG